MKVDTSVAALLALGTGMVRGSGASTIPPIPPLGLEKRTIYGPGGIQTPGRNISAIASWTYAALAHATITISNSTSELGYLCTNFDTLSTRYTTSYAQRDGDVGALAKEAICSASKTKIPSPLPIPQNMLWYMKYYTGGILNVQGYAAKAPSPQWYYSMCIYLEATLLRGLWAPCLDTDEGGVDVESGYCATAGYFQKGPYSTYTSATQPADVARQADVLMSKVMAGVFRVLAKESRHVEYVCGNWKKYEDGVRKTGLVPATVKEVVCGAGGKVVEVGRAAEELKGWMSELFVFQMLKAGKKDGYYGYLCETYSAEALSKYGLDGSKVVDAFCKAAA